MPNKAKFISKVRQGLNVRRQHICPIEEYICQLGQDIGRCGKVLRDTDQELNLLRQGTVS